MATTGSTDISDCRCHSVYLRRPNQGHGHHFVVYVYEFDPKKYVVVLHFGSVFLLSFVLCHVLTTGGTMVVIALFVAREEVFGTSTIGCQSRYGTYLAVLYRKANEIVSF